MSVCQLTIRSGSPHSYENHLIFYSNNTFQLRYYIFKTMSKCKRRSRNDKSSKTGSFVEDLTKLKQCLKKRRQKSWDEFFARRCINESMPPPESSCGYEDIDCNELYGDTEEIIANQPTTQTESEQSRLKPISELLEATRVDYFKSNELFKKKRSQKRNQKSCKKKKSLKKGNWKQYFRNIANRKLPIKKQKVDKEPKVNRKNKGDVILDKNNVKEISIKCSNQNSHNIKNFGDKDKFHFDLGIENENLSYFINNDLLSKLIFIQRSISQTNQIPVNLNKVTIKIRRDKKSGHYFALVNSSCGSKEFLYKLTNFNNKIFLSTFHHLAGEILKILNV